MQFDPHAATALYIDSLGPAALEKAHQYPVGKEWRLPWSLIVAAIVPWLIVKWGGLGRLEARFGENRRSLAGLVVGLGYFSLSASLTRPWTAYSSLWRAKAY